MQDTHSITKLADRIRKDRIEEFQKRILEHGKKAGGPFYIDEVDFDDLLCGKAGEGKHPNMIGIAVGILVNKRAIVRTGKFRNSERQGSNRRLIFQYSLASAVTKRPTLLETVQEIKDLFAKNSGGSLQEAQIIDEQLTHLLLKRFANWGEQNE